MVVNVMQEPHPVIKRIVKGSTTLYGLVKAPDGAAAGPEGQQAQRLAETGAADAAGEGADGGDTGGRLDAVRASACEIYRITALSEIVRRRLLCGFVSVADLSLLASVCSCRKRTR